MTDTTIAVDRKTHTKIKKLQYKQEQELERPVSIKEIVRNSINCYISATQE